MPFFHALQITERLCTAALKVAFRHTRRICKTITADVRAQDIVKLIVDEGDTTFRRKPKPVDVEPDTGETLCA